MKLQQVRFADISQVTYELMLERADTNLYHGTLVVKFTGTYRDGSTGNADAEFMRGITKTAIGLWQPASVVLDLSELKYEWGDQMLEVIGAGGEQGKTVAVVVGVDCRRAVYSLIRAFDSTPPAAGFESIFDSLEDALEFVRQKSK